MRTLLGLGLLLVLLPMSLFAESAERAMREDILRLSQRDSMRTLSAVERLRTAPRAKVLAVLRDDLSESPVSAAPQTLKAVVAVRAVELLPELKALASRTEEWQVFAAINALQASDAKIAQKVAQEFAVLYQERLSNLISPTAKVAVIEGLTLMKSAILDKAFAELLTATSFDVRLATVRNLVATHAQLKQPIAVGRFKQALEVQPKQARILAYREAARFPASWRGEIKTILKAERCESETDKRLQGACLEAVKTGRGGEK